MKSAVEEKSAALKQGILGLCINEGSFSISELSRELGASIPTITKQVVELMEEGLLADLGKIDTNGGRRPSIYGLNSDAGYFVGTEIHKTDINIAITDFKGHLADFASEIPFILENTEASFKELCDLIRAHLKSYGVDENKVLAYGFNLSGRVNNETGYCFSYFISEDRPIALVLEETLGKKVYVDNDSRAMTYGEYLCGNGNNEKNMLMLNVSWGLGMGMIIDGKLSYGKSGFSGEIGHFPFLDNDQICQCGKVGCLETGASGRALHRIFMEKLSQGRSSMLSDKHAKGEPIMLDDIIDAASNEDVLAIEAIGEIGDVLGRAVAGLINLFNPELVVIGGKVAEAKDDLLLPIKRAVRKHSLNMINKDTDIKVSKLGTKVGALGACMLSRAKLLGLI